MCTACKNDDEGRKEKRKEKQEKEKKEKEKRKRKRKRKGKKEEEEEEEEEDGLTSSHPSVKGQRPQERWIGAHWESQEANPFPSYRPFSFGPHYRLPAF